MEKQQLQILFFDSQRGWVKDTLEVDQTDDLRVEQNTLAKDAMSKHAGA